MSELKARRLPASSTALAISSPDSEFELTHWRRYPRALCSPYLNKRNSRPTIGLDIKPILRQKPAPHSTNAGRLPFCRSSCDAAITSNVPNFNGAWGGF